jgi:DNA-binding transcriptional LysR family regulator
VPAAGWSCKLIALISAISDPYHVELAQLETFLAVGTFGGFRRAAAALRVTQPAVSARIKGLEASLGTALFERGRPGLTPSEAGRILRPHAEQVLRAVALARQAVHQLRPASAGALEIAAALSICAYLLPDVLTRFQRAWPRVFVTVRSGHSKEVLEMVLRGEAELGLARSLQHPAVETLSLGDDPLLLVQPRTRALVAGRRARLEEVADRPLVFFDRGSSDWTLTHGLFRRAGLVPNVTLEVETIETAKRMVERGLGLAFLPRLAVAHELRQGAFAAIEIADAEPLRRSLDVVRARHRSPSPEALGFLEALRAAVREVGETRPAPPPRGKRRAAAGRRRPRTR